MKFSTTIMSLIAMALASKAMILPRGLNQPIFDCVDPQFGGCCTKFLEDGTGVGCTNADVINDADGRWTCNDTPADQGLPACCNLIHTLPGTHIGIPMPCQAISPGY